MGNPKITVFGENLIDITDSTVTASKMLKDTVAYDSDAEKITGNIETKTSTNVTASGATVTVPSGYYASQVQKSVATATQATPTIDVSDSGLITASCTQSTGYVSGGTKSATQQLSIANVYSGSSTPSPSLGSDGDIYLKV